ncbi:MAG: hypothetical protein BGP12_20940 [Rhodospirillales bacterium 70-18]|nr:MAG: hypothetical protein BGP12_20940 [Rhodospirillales bacterium 70-18]
MSMRRTAMTDTPSRPDPEPIPASPSVGRVLIVDDETAIADLLARSLGQRGFATATAHSAEQAKAVLAAMPDILVILSDIRMPGQDGLGLAGDVLGGRTEQQAVEVVLLTGNATTEAVLGALRTHVFDMVQKPFNLGVIADVVTRARARALERRQRAARDHQLQAQIRAAEDERARLLARLDESSVVAADAVQARSTSERARGDLLAVISHELRTPLIPVIGLAEVVLKTPDLSRADLLLHAQTILESGQRLLSLIDGALDIVAMDQGLRAMQRREFRIAELVERVVARAQATREQAGSGGPVDFIITGDTEAGADGDVRLVERALDHLVDNAIKAAPAGSDVSISWHDEGGMTVIAMTDHGAGIAAEVRAQLGRPFVQADMSRGRRWAGAGLGLAFAYRVAGAHGGRLVLAPGEGDGTRAELHLPHQARPDAGGQII